MPVFPVTLPPVHPDAGMAARGTGYNVWQAEDGQWVVDAADEAAAAAVQAWLDAYDPLHRERAEARARVDAEATRRINTMIPPQVQQQLIARGVQLLRKTVSGETWTPEETFDAMRSEDAWALAQQARMAADAIKASLAGIHGTEALQRYDPTEDPRWPF